MMRLLKVVAIGCLAAVMTACSQASPPSVGHQSRATPDVKRQLIGAAITEQVAGKRFQWIRARDQASGETMFAKDGSMSWHRIDVTSSGKGRWSVDDELICQEFDPTPQWKGGRVCRKLYKAGDTLTTSPNDGGLVTYNEVPAT